MKAKKLISWKVLDRYKTSRGIAAFLRKNHITGESSFFNSCPLAIATGYCVGAQYRWISGSGKNKKLTKAEKDFVTEFDLNVYPDLRRK